MRPYLFKLVLAFFIALQTCSGLYGQTAKIAGKVIDSETHLPVPYASVGIKGKSLGSMADENGNFNFQLDESRVGASDTVVISSVGYRNCLMDLSALKRSVVEIALRPLVRKLKEVSVHPKKYKTKVFGRTGNNTLMSANLFTERSLVDDNLGKEQASIIDIERNCMLKDFNMYVVFNHFENVKFRLLLYSVQNGLPDSLFIDQDILFDVPDKKGWVKVDLEKYNIQLKGYRKVAVSIQWVKSEASENFRKSFNVSVVPSPFHSVFFREKSQAEWRKFPSAFLAFNLTAYSRPE